MNKDKSCLNCRYYTDDIGEKGYCKLYRHNTSTPDVACPKFEKKENKEKRSSFNVERMKGYVLDEANLNRYKSSANKMLFMLSVACMSVLSVLLIFFSVVLCATLATFAQVRTLYKVIFIVVTVSFVISFIVILGMLLSKFKVMRLIVPLVSFVILIWMLVFSNEIWFDFNSLIMQISKTIFDTAV